MNDELHALFETYKIVHARVEHLLEYTLPGEIVQEIEMFSVEELTIKKSILRDHYFKHRHLPSHLLDTPMFHALMYLISALIDEMTETLFGYIPEQYDIARKDMAEVLFRSNMETRVSSRHFVWTTYSGFLEKFNENTK